MTVSLQNGAHDLETAPAERTGCVIRRPGRRVSPTPTAPATPTLTPAVTGPASPASGEAEAQVTAGLEDAAVVARALVDAEAFGELYDRYCDRIHGYVYRRLRSPEAAEDVTAEVFFKALKAIDT